MDIEKIPAIITEIQDDIKMLKRAVKANAPAQEVTTELNKEVKVLAQDGTITPLSAVRDTDKWDLEDIDGIIVPLLNGKRVLVYPKFKECPLLPEGTKWNGKQMNECDTLYNESDGEKETDELLALGSKAAEFVRNVRPGVVFNLPHNMLILAALYHFCEEFNAIAERIKGASALEFPAWSSAMYDSDRAWYCSNYGDFNIGYFCHSFMCVPCVLYTERSED